jgi:hypothetical protein
MVFESVQGMWGGCLREGVGVEEGRERVERKGLKKEGGKVEDLQS